MREKLLSLVLDALYAGALRKLVLSKSEDSAVTRTVCRLCSHKGEPILAMETLLTDGKALHKNVKPEDAEAELSALLPAYMQVNLVTSLGNAEYRRNKKGHEVLLGEKELARALASATPSFADALSESLDKSKNYILSGNEPFLICLGISDKNGRVHDKRQAKFRQINRFLEHVRDIEPHLPKDGTLLIYDLCCGKSYLSFAVYHYFTVLRGRKVEMLGMDLKADCMAFCADAAKKLGFDGMRFETGDIRKISRERAPHLVLSLHACDIATDIVLHFAASVRAGVILSTPCCQHDMLGKINTPALRFVSDYPKLSGKLCEALTDALRLSRLRVHGYETAALELTDPDDTPKNTLLRAVLRGSFTEAQRKRAEEEYHAALRFVLGREAKDYPEEIL